MMESAAFGLQQKLFVFQNRNEADALTEFIKEIRKWRYRVI